MSQCQETVQWLFILNPESWILNPARVKRSFASGSTLFIPLAAPAC